MPAQGEEPRCQRSSPQQSMSPSSEEASSD